MSVARAEGCRLLQSVYAALEAVDRASDSEAALVENVRVDHGGVHARVTQKLLDRAYIVATLQQMRRE